MGVDAQGLTQDRLPGGLCEEGLGLPHDGQGWFQTTQHRAQLSPQLSFSHRESLGKKRQSTAQSQGGGKKCDKQQRQHTPKSAKKEMFHMVPKQRIHSRL